MRGGTVLIVPIFMAVALCVGLFLLFELNPTHFFKSVCVRRRKESLRTRLLAAQGLKRQGFLEKQFAKTDEVLRITGRKAKIPFYRRLSVLLAVLGAAVGILTLNPSLALVLMFAGLLIPQFIVQMSAARFHKESREELFTALSLVTSSYERTGNLMWAVEENVAHIHPPVDAVFSEFLRQCSVVDPSVSRALIHVRGMMDNDIWREWCDAMQLCIQNPAQKNILRAIVEKSGRQNRVQNELDSLLPRPVQQMLLVMGMALINIPIVCYMFSDFATILFRTLQGKCGLAVMAAAVLFAVYKAIHAARPVEYRKAVNE
jgi:hypothetical protein